MPRFNRFYALAAVIAVALALPGCDGGDRDQKAAGTEQAAATNDTGGSATGDFGPPQGQPVDAVLTAPPRVPPPTGRKAPAKVIVKLDVIEKEMPISEGVTYTFWTFGGTVPGSFIRVRQGDTVEFVPLYGKLSDLYGRRKLYVLGMAIFLTGSILCGQASTMTEHILARGLQGIGAGGIMPLAFIMIGEMFSLEQRARMQGLFSGVWGISSIAGPLLGGFLVDQFSWQWVFYINIPFGLLAAGLVGFAWRDQIHARGRPVVDYAGAVLLTVSVVTLLVGLTIPLGSSISWVLIAASVILFSILLWVESRAADPILPLHLFCEKLFAVAILHGVLTGWALFGSISFIPLFVQSVLGTSATQAGITISPMLLGWVGASIIGTRLLLRVGYRKLAILGTALLTIGAFLMSQASVNPRRGRARAFAAAALCGREGRTPGGGVRHGGPLGGPAGGAGNP